MAFLDHNGESEFPMDSLKVFNAILKAISHIKSMEVISSDSLQKRIAVKSRISLFSWGENIPIQLIEISENKTKVQITSSPKTGLMFGGAFDLGKNRKNIENILYETSKILQSGADVDNIVFQRQPKRKGGCLKYGLIVLGVIIFICIIASIVNSGMDNSVKSEQQKVENQVASDAEKQYDIAKKNGSAIDAYTQAGIVTAAYLQAQDSINYRKWKKIEHQEAIRAGVPE
jgi:hypothetical protein